MKNKLRKQLALLLAVCMCISACPIIAFAETEEVKIKAVTATAQPLASTANGPVTLTTASIFPAEDDFYVKFDGLGDADYYLVQVQVGLYSEIRYLFPNGEESVVTSMYYNLPVGSNSITLTIGDKQGNELYHPVTLTTQVVENLPATLEEIQSFSEITEMSLLDSRIYVSTYLPVGTLTGDEELSLELVKDGVVYAATTEESYCRVYTRWLRDPRYAAILGEDAYVSLSVQTARCEVYCGRELVEGAYDVLLYANGKLISTHKDAAVCYSQPIVSGQLAYGVAGTYNVVGSKMAGIQLNITNGDPADFSVELYLQGEEVAVSTGYRVVSAYDTECEAVYYIPLDEPMEQYQEYEFRVKYKGEGDFIMENSDLVQYIYDKVAADWKTIQFGSYYYANFVLPSFGYDAGVQYKFELYNWDDLLATTYASPNNDGLFNLEFRGKDGQLIELEQNTEYEILFYGNPDNPDLESRTWYLYNQYLRREAAALALLSAAETHTLNVEYATVSQDSVEQIFVQVSGEDAKAVHNEYGKYKLHLTSVTGVEHLLDVKTANLYNSDYVAQLEFSVPEGFEDAYYYVELLYNGKQVVNAAGENVFVYGDLMNFSSQATVGIGYGRSREVLAVIGANPDMLDGKAVTVELFSMLNDTAEPDCTLTLTEDDDYIITDADMAKLNPAVRYKAVISAEGKALDVTEYEYWASRSAMFGEGYGKCGTVTVAEDMKDYLEIVPCYTNYDAEAGIPYYSEVYVNVTAPEGKALQYITVNGEKICGNGFLFTGDCVVSAIFEEAETVTFKATVQMGVEEWIYNNGMTEEEMEEKLSGMTEEEQEAFWESGGSAGSWVFKVLHSYECNFQPNSMQELDLTLPETLDKYKIENIYAECADPEQWASVSHDGTETHWFLYMPECDVVVKAVLREKQSYRVVTQYESSLGTVTGLESSYFSVTEGETVSFTAAPIEDNLLQSVYYEYYGYEDGSWGTHTTTLTPDENGVYSFVMPASYVDLYINFTTSGPYTVNAYAYGLGTVVVSDSASEGGYMAGEKVTLTVTPNEGSRLVKKDAIQGGYYMGYEYRYVEFTKVNDTTYTFQMPHGNVSIDVCFEITPGVAPGGTVVDNDTLIKALGGKDNAVLNAETGAVQLLKTVELFDSILVAPEQLTEFILDLNGNRIIVVKDNENVESGAIVLHQNGLARFTLTNSINYGSIVTDGEVRNNFHMIWVQGGSLTVEGKSEITIVTAYSPVKRSSAGIRVAGGEATLGNLRIEAQLASDALHLSGGTTTILDGMYYGGMDYYNQYRNQQTSGLNLLGGYEDYSWINSSTLGGSAIRVTGRATVKIEKAYAFGGAHGAALHIDNRVSTEYPCTVDVWGGGFYADAGKGLLVESGDADVTLHYGEFQKGDAPYGYYSMDVTNYGCIADYLAPDRKVENLERYVGYVDGENIYEEIAAEDLQSSYLYANVRISDSPSIVVNGALDAVMNENATAEEIQQAVESLNSATLKEVLVAEPDSNGEETSVAEKLAQLEAKLEITTSIETSEQMAEIFDGELNMIGAAFNADEDSAEVKVTIAVKECEEEPSAEKYSGGIQFSMTISGAADVDIYNDGHQLEVPVLLVLPLHSSINPALLTVLHYNEATGDWEELDQRVYEEDGKWFVAFATDGFSDYALKHKLTASKVANSVRITMEAAAFAQKDIQFQCAVYSRQGQMLGVAPVNAAGNTDIELGDKAAQAYEVKVFTVSADGSWKPLFGEETILLGNVAN